MFLRLDEEEMISLDTAEEIVNNFRPQWFMGCDAFGGLGAIAQPCAEENICYLYFLQKHGFYSSPPPLGFFSHWSLI